MSKSLRIIQIYTHVDKDVEKPATSLIEVSRMATKSKEKRKNKITVEQQCNLLNQSIN